MKFFILCLSGVLLCCSTLWTNNVQGQCVNATVRKYTYVVGSSTVFPFASMLFEYISKKSDLDFILSNTGTGIGIQMFCSGVGSRYPDMVTASRHITKEELAHCKSNGVDSFRELLLGYDGIVVVTVKNGLLHELQLSWKDILKAIAAYVIKDNKLVSNPYMRWSDINPQFPDVPIQIFGPTATSGTRQALVEILANLARRDYEYSVFAAEHPEDFHKMVSLFRDDGVYIEVNKNDNIVIQKIQNNSQSLAFIGVSFFNANKEVLSGLLIQGKAPTLVNISNTSYLLRRPLYVFVKDNVFSEVVDNVLNVFDEERKKGENSFLYNEGLILPDDLFFQPVE